MTVFKFLFDWLVGIPAVGVAYLIACLLGLMGIAVPSLVWHWTIKLLEPDPLEDLGFPGTPGKISTGVIAGIAALYLFAVAATAFYNLPRVMSAMGGSD